MTVTCDWYSRTKAIIGMKYAGNWTIEECEAANLMLWEMLETVTERYDVIVDLTEAGYTLPIGILWHWKQQMSYNDTMFPKWGVNIYVTRNDVYKAYLNEGIETSDAVCKHCRIVKTVEAAMILIQEERQGVDV